MKYKITNSIKPAYIQIYEQIKEDILSKSISFNSKLPSKRILAEEIGVSVITIEHALELLFEEGYIEKKERKGYFVIYREKDFLLHNHLDENQININEEVVSQKSPFPNTSLFKTMRKVIAEYGDKLQTKSNNKGNIAVRSAIANYLNRSVGIKVDYEQIVIGAGAEYLYSLVLQLLGKNNLYALENPCYERIKQVYNANGVRFELLDLGKNGIKTEQLQNSKATILHVTPYNSFPSLITASASKRQEYLLWAKQRKGFIIEDNYDSELTVSKKHEDTLFSLSNEQNVIYLNTFNRTISPSMRVGYMVLPKSLLSKFDLFLGFYSCTVPVFEQYLIAELLNSGEFERHINRVRRQKRK